MTKRLREGETTEETEEPSSKKIKINNQNEEDSTESKLEHLDAEPEEDTSRKGEEALTIVKEGIIDGSGSGELNIAERVVSKWKQLQKEDPKFDVALEQGIDAEKIVKWETEHKVTLPDTLKTLYRLVNGQQGAKDDYNKSVGLFGDNIFFAPLEPAARRREKGEEDASPILAYSGGFEDMLYNLRPGPRLGYWTGKENREFVAMNGVLVKLVDFVIIGCKLQEEHSEYYILVCYAQSDSPEILYDVILHREQDEPMPFGVGGSDDGKPSKSRFDDWLMAYETHLIDHLEDFYNSNDTHSPDKILFLKFHEDVYFTEQRSLKTKSASKLL